MRRLALVPTLIAALLLPGGAHALGLGEIEIQSALNQRLDAEIPLRGVPSGQSEGIEVSLASEEAFSNVGLDRPYSLTRLQFTVKQRGDGGHYVHVTSRESIVEPFLSFLVEVDWSGGNLLREYTVLLDPPVFTSEEDSDPERSGGGTTDTARTAETSDDAGVTGEIERDVESSGAQSDAEGGEARSASGSGQSGSSGGEDKPVFLEVEEREERARAQADAERTDRAGGSASRSSGAREQYGPVGDGETLWSIASRLKSGDMTVQQMMIALLRYNPDAFRGENVNRLKKGYVLRVPNADRVLEVSAQRALARVREQNGVWQELQEGARSRTSVAASDQGSGDAGTAAETATGADDGELSIVGADDGGASSDEATSATGSSSRDESEKLQLAREELESTRLEKEELESRVNELEQTVSKMEKLLEVRDERLSALQEELRRLEGRQGDEESARTAADDESGADVASTDDTDAAAADDEQAAADDESGADSGDDEETVAAADTDGGEDAAAGTTATDGGSGDGDATVAGDGGTASDEMASADSADAGEAENAETTASAEDEADESYIPEDKQVTDADRGLQTTRTQEPEETWLDQVNAVVAAVTGVFAGVGAGLLAGPMGFGLAAAIVLLGGGLILMRRRREAAESDGLDAFDPDDTNSDLAPFDPDSSGRFGAEAPEADVDTADTSAPSASAEDAQSALMDEEFDVGSLDDEEPADRGGSGPLDEPSRGADDEEAEKDDTVAEADVYLAYGLHQQSEDLLRLALREQPGNAMYHEKLLETLYASGKTEEFIEEAETFRGMVDGPDSRLWQRVLAMGRELAPQHELFAEGDTEFTAADVQPTRPAGTDLELDDSEGEIDFGLDDEPESAAAVDSGPADKQDDDFSSTMMLDSADFEAVEGDGGLVGPGDDRPGDSDSGTAAATAAGGGDEDEDLEFDLGDLDGLSEDDSGPAAASAGPGTAAGDSDEIDFDLDDDTAPESGNRERSDGAADEGALDFDLDFEEPESPKEGLAGIDEGDSGEAEAPANADSDDGGLDFDFDLEETSPDSSASGTAEQHSAPAEPAGSADDEPLEIGDLEIGDLDALDSESDADEGTGDAEPRHDSQTAAVDDDGEADAEAFDLSDLETGEEATTAVETAGGAVTSDDGAADDDAFDLSDLDSVGGADDDGAFNLDDLGAAEPDSMAPDAAGPAETGAPATEPQADETTDATGGVAAAPGADSAPDDGAVEDEEFDTMLDLARAYIDMGDPESATNALEEVAASGNEQQRSEAQSLLESIR